MHTTVTRGPAFSLLESNLLGVGIKPPKISLIVTAIFSYFCEPVCLLTISQYGVDPN